ncbi:MAG: hypothetical protein ACI4BA_09380 [Prevotella sp.]
MKTLRKIGLVMMAVCMIAGLASCGSDDDDNSGGGASGEVSGGSSKGALVVNGTNYGFNYCYIYDSTDGELMFTNHDMLNFNGSYTDHAMFQIYFKNQIFSFENLTLNPGEYELWFDCGGRITNTEVNYQATYVWDPEDDFLKAQNPGTLTINRTGNNIHVKVENLWLYGGDGFDDVFKSGLPAGYNWLNGSFEYNGVMTDISSIMD